MKLNFFRKPTFSILMSFLILTVSCTSNSSIDETNKFDYSTLNKFKTTGFNLNIPIETKNIVDDAERFQSFVNIINNQYDTDLSVNDYDSNLIGIKNSQNKSLSKSDEYVFSENDIYLMDKLNNDIDKFGFKIALVNLEKNVIDLKVGDEEFAKYNLFANVISIIHNDNPDVFTQEGDLQARLTACQKAIIANALATVGLAACGTGFFCGVAIAAKVLALDAVLDACAGRPFL